MDARTNRRQKRISKQQEERAAADLGGRTQAASGATRLGGGGDVRVLSDTRVECKVTEKNVYVLKWEELDKVRRQAIAVLEQPVFQFAFRSRAGRLDAYAVVPWGPDEEAWELACFFNPPGKSTRLHQSDLEEVLGRGQRIRLLFVIKDKGDVRFARFEIMTWSTFLERRKDAV